MGELFLFGFRVFSLKGHNNALGMDLLHSLCWAPYGTLRDLNPQAQENPLYCGIANFLPFVFSVPYFRNFCLVKCWDFWIDIYSHIFCLCFLLLLSGLLPLLDVLILLLIFRNHVTKKKKSFLFSDCSFFIMSYFHFYVYNISLNFTEDPI